MKVTATKAEVTALVAAAVEQGAAVELVARADKAPEAAVEAPKAARKARSPKAPAAEFVGPLPQATEAPAAKTPAPKLAPDAVLALTDMAEAVAPRATIQRSAKGFGKAWRQNGKTDTSVRFRALEAITAVASEEGTVAYADALKALTGLDLGCSSPATRISKFLRSGHLELQA
jgi:hypothetical protein